MASSRSDRGTRLRWHEHILFVPGAIGVLIVAGVLFRVLALWSDVLLAIITALLIGGLAFAGTAMIAVGVERDRAQRREPEGGGGS